MDRSKELELIDAALALARDGAPALTDDEARLDVARYLDPDRFARERERVFRRTPCLVAHQSALAQPGDFLTLELGGLPALLVRGDDGRLNARVNVCRHRGTIVESRAQGSCKRFVCPYHAWTYDRSGALVHVRHREAFPSLDAGDPRDTDLVPLPCLEHAGLVWVAGAPGSIAAPDPELSPALRDELRWLGTDQLEIWDMQTRVWRANWKLLADGGLESYHFKIAHRETIARFFLDAISSFEFFGPHTRSILPRASILELDGQPREQWRLRSCANVLYSLFPSASLLVQDDHVVMVLMTPVAVDATRVDITTLAPAGERGGPRAKYWHANHALTCATLAEDFSLAEQIQRGLQSGANTHLRIGRCEGAITRLHAIIDARLA